MEHSAALGGGGGGFKIFILSSMPQVVMPEDEFKKVILVQKILLWSRFSTKLACIIHFHPSLLYIGLEHITISPTRIPLPVLGHITVYYATPSLPILLCFCILWNCSQNALELLCCPVPVCGNRGHPLPG